MTRPSAGDAVRAGHRDVEPSGRTRIWYGADYYPEQWDADTVARDIELMTEAKVNLVTVGVFAWAQLQPEPASWRLDWLDSVVAALGEAGIAVDLATPTASVPAWMAALDPSLASVDASGNRRASGARGYHCPTSPVYREATREIVGALARRFAGNEHVAMWHIGNEFGPTECFCDRCGQEFRSWLARRYGSVDALNEAWGTTFWSLRVNEWSDVHPPRTTTDFPNPSHTLDWARFHSDLLLAQFTAERDIIKAVDSRPVLTNYMGLYPKLDYWAWSREADAVANDAYPDPNDQRAARTFAFDSDLMRSLAGGKPFVQMEQAVSAVQWRAINTPKRPGQFALWSMQTVARGAGGIMQFQWRAAAAGAETFHSAMVSHAGAVGRRWQEVVRLGEDLETLALCERDTVRARVAILVDWESLWARRCAHGPDDRSPDEETRRWHAAFYELGIATDFVSPASDLSAYRLVVLAGSFLVSAPFAAKIDEFVAGGGHVVATYLTGVVDEHLHAYPGYPGPLVDLLGIRVLEHWPLLDEPLRPVAAGARVSAAVVVPGAGIRAARSQRWGSLEFSGFAERLELAGAEPLATFVDDDLAGCPVATENLVGAGRATYVAVRLTETSLAAVARSVAEAAGARPVLAENAPGIEAVRRGDTLFLLNHGESAQVVSIEPAVAAVDGEPTSRVVVGPRDYKIVRLTT